MKGRIRKLISILLALALMCANLSAIAEAVLALPKALKIIDTEAFYGDTAIDKVVVPEGTTEIRARAFANSTLSEINLPDSLTFIDDTAFEGLSGIAVTASEGSYAYDWAVRNGFIVPEPAPTPTPEPPVYPVATTIRNIRSMNTEPICAGQSMLWYIDAYSGAGTLNYAYYLKYNGVIIDVRDFETSSYYSAVLNKPGIYSLMAICKDEEGKADIAESEPVQVKNAQMRIATIEAPEGTFVEGETITWMVSTVGGTEPIQYNYILYKDGEVQDRVDAAFENAYSYIASSAGNYQLAASCVDADETACEMTGEEIQVLPRKAAYPAAPELCFAANETAFSTDESNIPEFAPQSLGLTWSSVEYVTGYQLRLDKRVDGEWVEVLCEEGIVDESYPLSASLYNGIVEREEFRLTLTSCGLINDASNIYYYAVNPVVVNKEITIDGAASITWNQNSKYASTRTFDIQSDTEWTVESVQASMSFRADYTNEWIICEIQDDKLTVKISESDEERDRNAVITLTNGYSTAILNINQGYASDAPVMIAPFAFSTDALNPSEYPVGGFTLKWDKKDNGRVRIRVSECMNDGSSRQFYEGTTSLGYEYITEKLLGETLKSGSVYAIELAGVYGSSWAMYEREEDILLKSVYYVRTVDHGHSITINGKNTAVYRNILKASCYIEASGNISYTSDVDWLSVSGFSNSDYKSNAYVYAEQNTTGASREGHITFVCGDATATVTVIQDDMTPKVLHPESLSQNENSPTTLYMDLNLLDENYFYFIYQGKRLYLERYVDGTYGEMTKLHSNASYGTYSTEIETRDVSGASWCRLTAVSDEVSSVYYVRFRDSDSDLYDTFSDTYMSRNVGAHQNTFKVSIGTTTKWTVSSNASWLKPAVGSGAAGVKASNYEVSFNVNVDANTTGKPRTGRLTLKSTTSKSVCWVDVKQADDNVFILCGENTLNDEYEPYDPSVHSAEIFKGKACKTDSFRAYGTQTIKVTSNVDWVKSSDYSPDSGDRFYLNLTDNPAGNGVRTGTVTVSDGINSAVITVRQAPGLGAIALVSPSLSTDYDNPSVVGHENMRVVWNAVQNAVKYKVRIDNDDYSYKSVAEIPSTGVSQYSFVLPKEMLKAFAVNKLKVVAFDQYGFSASQYFYFMPTPDDAALINGSSAPMWSNAPDSQTVNDYVIQSSGAWTAAADKPWITLSAASGVSGDTLTVTLAENTSNQPRSGRVTVTVGSSKTVIKIEQCAYLAE